jgi:RNA polymerase sigma-70 factor (ECF subfamily)
VDELTLETARRGDRNAQAALLRELQDVWFRMSMTLLHDPDLARDATQETAFRFLKQLPAFRGDSQLRTWSLGIAINVCREFRRRSARPLPEPLRLTDPTPPAPTPDQAAESAESAVHLHTVLADLPDRQREVVLLRFFEDLSVDETAAAMHCAPGTVKATLHQALKSLKRRLSALAP